MNIDFYTLFFEDKPDLELSFSQFGEKFNIPVGKKLKAIKDKDEFLAEIIEYRFGVFFGSLFENVEHERRVFPDSLFKPDWTITSHSQLLVAEVIRLNPSKSDSEEMQMSGVLMEALETISGDYLVQLKYNYEEVKDLSINPEEIKNHVEGWLNTGREVGNYIEFLYKIRVVIKQKNIGLTHVGVMGPFSTINFDYRRLAGENSRLFSKLKYAEAVNKHELPYIICMHLSFESWFKPEDMYEKLYGRSGVFHGNQPFNEYYPGALFHTFSDGLYYCNEIIKDSVSGIVVYYQGEFTFFPNYNQKNRLNCASMQLLDEYVYKDLKS